ncbi:MAG: hypothetical protein ACQ9IQ_07865, partial [Nitrospirales bacterium]
MKLGSPHILWQVFVCALLLINPAGLAAQEPMAVQPSSEAPAPPTEVPHLADLIPRVTTLVGRLAQLETTLKTSEDPSEVQNRLLEIDSSLKKYAAELQKLKTTSIAGGGQLMKLQLEITSMAEVLKGIQRSVTEQLRTLVDLQNEWVKKQEQWKTWRAALLSDESPAEIKGTFDKAEHTIDKAFGHILPQLQPLLALQKHIGRHQTRLKTQTTEVHSVYTPAQSDASVDSSPPMFSAHYVGQFLKALGSP